MTDNDRITKLEAQVAELQTHRARLEREHHGLLKVYEEASAAREKLRTELEADFTLLGQSFDRRIDELKPRAAGGAAPEEWRPALTELCNLLAGFTVRHINALIASQSEDRAQVTRTTECTVEHMSKLADRIEMLERRMAGHDEVAEAIIDGRAYVQK